MICHACFITSYSLLGCHPQLGANTFPASDAFSSYVATGADNCFPGTKQNGFAISISYTDLSTRSCVLSICVSYCVHCLTILEFFLFFKFVIHHHCFCLLCEELFGSTKTRKNKHIHSGHLFFWTLGAKGLKKCPQKRAPGRLWPTYYHKNLCITFVM